MDLDNIQRKYGLPAPLPVVQNGKFAPRFPLNLEHRGDDVFQFGGKYIGEIENIYDLLYKILTNQEIDASLALPYAIKITEDKLYIRDKTNSEWITIFDITKPNFPKEIELYELIYKAITHQVIGEDTSYPGQFKIEENILYVRDKDNLIWTQIGDVTKEFLGATEATQAILDQVNEILTEVQELKTELVTTTNEALTTVIQAANEAMISAQSINIRTFNSVEEMKASNTLKAGALAKTLGFYTAGDGGGADYVITNDIGEDEADEATLISLQKELYAKLLIKDFVNIKQMGAKGDGVTDDTEKIQNAINFCINNNYTLYIPIGTFLVTETLNVEEIIIKGENKEYSILKTNDNIVIFNIGSNTKITNLYLQSKNYCLMSIKKAKNITIANNKALGGLYSTTSMSYSTDLTDDDLTQNIKVYENEVIGENNDIRGIALWYVKNVQVYSNKIDKTHDGVMWWGGDGNPTTGNGLIENPCFAKDIIIKNNYITNIGKTDGEGGGIWGSMGKNVSVNNNYVYNCFRDVGIDVEGGEDIVVYKNYVKNAKNATLAVFFEHRNIIFDGNIVEQDGTVGTTLLKKYGAVTNQKDMEKGLNVINNVFNSTNNNKFGFIGPFVGALNIRMEGNTFYNCIVFAGGNYSGNVKFNNNKISYNKDLPFELYRDDNDGELETPLKCAVKISCNNNGSSSVGEIKNNIIKVFSITVSPDVSGLYVKQNAYGGESKTVIDSNNISDFTKSITFSGDTSNIGNCCYINNNIVSGIIENLASQDSIGKGTIVLNKNKKVKSLDRNYIFAEYPDAIPTEGYWVKGQKIFYNNVTAGGKEGAICVETGFPGVWKEFGSIES